MLSNKPYLMRAFYSWIVDSRCTPILVINANFPGVLVPDYPTENGELIFNVSPEAIRDFVVRQDKVEFRASFSGMVHVISIPIKAVLALYAEENKQGMYFDYEDEDFFDDSGDGEGLGAMQSSMAEGDDKKAKRHLRLVE